ncbi:sensor histidine kinase [Streptomyces sp. NBRC 109706]|uniref:sensor histidine kinase n=1 Tax=Streptomyces sp. NBRC 109706 TaxID=1550035 RepID=UPI00082FF197|nr:histidine kinase [Streptomyces sp. NBRC 109706]
MRILLRPLRRADTYRGWALAMAGAAFGLPAVAVAFVAALAPGDWARATRWAAFVVLLALLTVAAGALPAVRRLHVRLANRLLNTGLPAPLPRAGSAWSAGIRTTAWLVLHQAVGWALFAGTLVCVTSALVFTGVWIGGGDDITFFNLSVHIAAGPAGAWTPPVSATALLLGALSSAAATRLLRRAAPALLGHDPDERFAALETQIRELEQRNLLARELHDSVGHTLTAATVQAAVAGQLLETDPAAARRALTAIEESSRSALDDLDHVLGVLREGRAPTTPEHTLADLAPLLDRLRHTGTDIDARAEGDLTRLPAAVSREAYRIVQEGLTNALRHARHAPVTLRVTAADDWLAIELSNPLPERRIPRAPRPRGGRGLTGLGERVRLLRGEFTAGRDARKERWRLAARIPLRPVS